MYLLIVTYLFKILSTELIDDDNYSEHNYNLFLIFSLKTVIEIIVYSAWWRS